MDLLSLRRIGAVVARNSVTSSYSQQAFAINGI